MLNTFTVYRLNGKRIPDPEQIAKNILTRDAEIADSKKLGDDQTVETLESIMPRLRAMQEKVQGIFEKHESYMEKTVFEYQKNTFGIDNDARDLATKVDTFTNAVVFSNSKYRAAVLEKTVKKGDWKNAHPEVVNELFGLITAEDGLTADEEDFFLK